MDKHIEEFEAFMADRFGDSIDRNQCLNGDGSDYMAWDMQVAKIVWMHITAKLEAAQKERDEAIVLNKHLELSIRKGEVVNSSLRERAEKAEAQAESNALEIRKLGLQWSRAEKAEKELEKEGNILIDAMDSMRQWKQRAEAAEARLLVPVKLPDIRGEDYHETGWFQHMKYYRAVVRSLQALGFKVEGE